MFLGDSTYLLHCGGRGVPSSLVFSLPDNKCVASLDTNTDILAAMALPSMPATRQLSLPLPGNMSVVGIDFGNDTCYISVARQGGIESIANDYSLRETPSYVAFGEKSRTIGVAAKSGQMTQIKRTFFVFKKLLGR